MYKINSTIAWQIYDNVLYIFDDVNRRTFILTDVSIVIWKLIANGYSHEAILQHIVNAYVVDVDVVKNDVNAFVNDLIANGLLEVIA